MAPMKHSTPKISAYSIYSRNNRSPVVPERNVVHAKPVPETRKKDSNVDIEPPSQRKRRVDIVKKINGTLSEEEVVKKKRGRKQKNVQKVTPVTESSHSDSEQELEVKEEETESEEDVSINFKPSISANASTFKRQRAACGNEASEEAFRWILSPFSPEVFFKKAWDKEPFLIPRQQSDFYKGIYSVHKFEKIVKENYLNYDQEIDVVKYVDGQRIPFENNKKVLPSHLWGLFQDGYSIRMRNPQVYCKTLGNLCSLLQEYFSSYVGTNMYFTPANSQGFPPHFDDIDAFVLQIEGKKHWKLYTPSDEDMLSRNPSSDLTEDEIGEPCLEVVLNPGDMLYFPRGFIHQAKADPDMYSLHITLSTNQLNTWADLLHVVFQHALDRAIVDDVELRKSIPKDCLNYMGFAYTDTNSKERQDFKKKGMSLIQKVINHVNFDSAVDSRAVDFIHGSMPPVLTEDEKACSIHGNEARFKNGKLVLPAELNSNTKIRFIRKRAFALDVEDTEFRLYHSLTNGKNHKEKDATYIEVNAEIVTALTELLMAYPKYIKIKDLTCKNPEVLMTCLQEMYDSGFFMTETPSGE